MTTLDVNKLADIHLQAWNERSAEKRVSLFQQIYAAHITFFDPGFEMTGFEPVSNFVSDLLSKNPGFSFTPARPAEANHNMIRLFWQFGTAEKTDIVTGMDLFEIEEGRVTKLYAFIDAPQK